jgi:hypothetical protein
LQVAIVVTQAAHHRERHGAFQPAGGHPRSTLTRGLRFFTLAGLLRWYGAPGRAFIEARLTLVTTGFAALIVLGLLSIRYL